MLLRMLRIHVQLPRANVVVLICQAAGLLSAALPCVQVAEAKDAELARVLDSNAGLREEVAMLRAMQVRPASVPHGVSLSTPPAGSAPGAGRPRSDGSGLSR